jgi:hypothetical protein
MRTGLIVRFVLAAIAGLSAIGLAVITPHLNIIPELKSAKLLIAVFVAAWVGAQVEVERWLRVTNHLSRMYAARDSEYVQLRDRHFKMTGEALVGEEVFSTLPEGTPRTGKVHSLKCASGAFDAIIDGRKRFEYRLNDREFHVGDTLELHEIVDAARFNLAGLTGRTSRCRVTYIVRGQDYGVPLGYCVMSIVHEWSSKAKQEAS